MSDAKHTPGPWEIPDQTWTRNLTVNTAGGMEAAMIACPGSGGAMSYTDEVCTLSWKDDGEWLANARLIAAAPELLEACKAAYNILQQSRPDSGWFNAYGHIIDKAEGRHE